VNDTATVGSLDLNLLRVFAEVYRERSLTRAAQTLHLTQPAVSNALARLRNQLDDPLFVRDGRRMSPTPKARELSGPVLRALAMLSAALGTAGMPYAPSRSERTYYVGMREVIEAMLLAPLVQEIGRVAPLASVASVRFERRLLTRMLAARTLDFAVDVRLPDAPGIVREPLAREPLCIAMRRGHPLAEGPLGLDAWLGASHVAVSARREGATYEELMLAQAGDVRREGRRVAVRCQHYYAACAVVAESNHLLTLPRRYAERMKDLLPLVLRPMPEPLPELELCVYFHSGAERDPGLGWLIDAARGLRARPERGAN
jgi:DNA-binding transcriptional LysR family regulator